MAKAVTEKENSKQKTLKKANMKAEKTPSKEKLKQAITNIPDNVFRKGTNKSLLKDNIKNVKKEGKRNNSPMEMSSKKVKQEMKKQIKSETVVESKSINKTPCKEVSVNDGNPEIKLKSGLSKSAKRRLRRERKAAEKDAANHKENKKALSFPNSNKIVGKLSRSQRKRLRRKRKREQMRQQQENKESKKDDFLSLRIGSKESLSLEKLSKADKRKLKRNIEAEAKRQESVKSVEVLKGISPPKRQKMKANINGRKSCDNPSSDEEKMQSDSNDEDDIKDGICGKEVNDCEKKKKCEEDDDDDDDDEEEEDDEDEEEDDEQMEEEKCCPQNEDDDDDDDEEDDDDDDDDDDEEENTSAMKNGGESEDDDEDFDEDEDDDDDDDDDEEPAPKCGEKPCPKKVKQPAEDDDDDDDDDEDDDDIDDDDDEDCNDKEMKISSPKKGVKTEKEKMKKCLGEPGADGKSSESKVGKELTIFMGNLDFKATEEEVRKFVESVLSPDEIETIELGKNQQGKPRGFGFLKVTTQEAFEKALKLNGEKLNNREVRMLKSEKRSEKRESSGDFRSNSRGGFRGGFGGRGGSGGRGRGGFRGSPRGGGRGSRGGSRGSFRGSDSSQEKGFKKRPWGSDSNKSFDKPKKMKWSED